MICPLLLPDVIPAAGGGLVVLTTARNTDPNSAAENPSGRHLGSSAAGVAVIRARYRSSDAVGPHLPRRHVTASGRRTPARCRPSARSTAHHPRRGSDQSERDVGAEGDRAAGGGGGELGFGGGLWGPARGKGLWTVRPAGRWRNSAWLAALWAMPMNRALRQRARPGRSVRCNVTRERK